MIADLDSLFRSQVRRLGNNPAWLVPDESGRYTPWSWRAVAQRVDRLACQLQAKGVRTGERVGIHMANCWQWLVCDLAIWRVGAVSVPVHAGISESEADELFAWVGAGWVFRGAGELLWLKRPALEVATVPPADLATILFTSGTTGRSRGVMLTHSQLLANARAAQAATPFEPGMVLLNWLPFSHIFARLSDFLQTMLAGGTLALARSAQTVTADLRVVQPHALHGVPRFFEKMLAGHRQPGQLRQAFGPRLRWLHVGGAPLALATYEAYAQERLPLIQGYGLTEASPVIAFNRLDDNRAGTVGRPLPGVEVRLAEDGEILARGPNIMAGYWDDPAGTAEAIREGWLYTGDLGELTDGYLSITGRKKELIVLSTGKKVAPNKIEDRLRTEPWLEQVVVVGDGQPCLGALLVGLPPPGLDVRERLRAALAELPAWEQVRCFTFLAQPLSYEQGELTISLKLRRKAIVEKYANEIARMYQSQDQRMSIASP